MVPVPLADVVTAGTSWTPVSFTATSSAVAAPMEIAEKIAATANERVSIDAFVFMYITPLESQTPEKKYAMTLLAKSLLCQRDFESCMDTSRNSLAVCVLALLAAAAPSRAGEPARAAEKI